MKKHVRQVASLLLACMIVMLAPVQVWAAQTDEKEMGSELEDMQKTDPSEEDKAEVGKDETEIQNRTDALNEPGEVTEPITKADKPYLALGSKSDAGPAGRGIAASRN